MSVVEISHYRRRKAMDEFSEWFSEWLEANS